MRGKTFVDTNVLVYAHDADQPAKRALARRVLDELWKERTGALSVQVLQEFYVTVTQKIPKPLTAAAAQEIVGAYSPWCRETGAAEISTAFRIESESRISFWDALIFASALKAGAERVVTEDLNPGQVISGVRVENPFAE